VTVPITPEDVTGAALRIAGAVERSPLRLSEWLSASDANVFCKLEVVQPTSSYKIRGAFNAVMRAFEEGLADDRLITASAGNHGRALAYAANMYQLPLVVFIPADAPRAKVDAIRRLGADLRSCASYDEAERQAKAFAQADGGRYISPYTHPDVIAGAGTIGLELIEQEPSLDTVVVPVGGGGLISGIAIALKSASPSTRVIGVEVAASCPFTRSLAAGRIVPIDVQPSLADGLTGNLDPDTITFDIVRDLVDEIVVVDEPDLRAALAGVAANEHLIVEGAAAAGPASLLSGKVKPAGRVAVVLTGANIDTDRLVEVLVNQSPPA
jgi:threonine dehydratase